MKKYLVILFIFLLAGCASTSYKDFENTKGLNLNGELQAGDSLPDQTGHAGEFLRTDGTDADWAAVAGGGDVLSVGDCLDGACLDGTSDGGTYIRLYDGDSHYGEFQVPDIAANVTYTFPAVTDTILGVEDINTIAELNAIITDANLAEAPTNVTIVDSGDENATFYLMIVDGLTGSQAIETDAGLPTYNPSTNTLDMTGTNVSMGLITLGNGATSAGYLRFLEDTDNGSNYIDLIGPAALAGNYVLTIPTITGADTLVTLGLAQTYTAKKTFSSIGLPFTTSGDQTIAEGEIGQKSDEDGIVFHGGSTGEVQDEAIVTLLRHLVIPFDPETEYDTTTNHIIDIGTLGDDCPHGITLTEWKCNYINGDPTTELDADLVCDTTPDYDPAAGATVMDVLDTTAGTSSADSGFDSATCVNSSQLYIRFGADPVDSGERVTCEFWFYANEN